MTSVILAVEGINKLLTLLNLGAEAGLPLYQKLVALTKGTADPLPELPDSAVITLFKQRSEDNREWTISEQERVQALIDAEIRSHESN
jgi:hypothetical protein